MVAYRTVTMKDRYAVILNPVAGKGKALAAIPEIETYLRRYDLDFEMFYTEEVLHAATLAETARENGFSVVVAAGGDGTCNEVINGLMACRQERGNAPVLGVLPVGRGNDFAYGAGVPAKLEEACTVLSSGTRAPLDVGRITGGNFPDGRFFGNGIGIGFDTIVGLEATRNPRLHGTLSYVYGALRTLVIYPDAPSLTLAYNETRRAIRSPQISIMNGRRMGGTFHMAPTADNSDGLLDLCMATRPLRRAEMIRLILHYTKGTQNTSPLIETARAPHFVITALEGGLACHADGETVCVDGVSLTVECVHGPLTVCTSVLVNATHNTVE